MADINIGSDQLLVTTLSDNDRVTITREATAQQVAAIKVADFRKKMYGVDYSILTEQIVPGELFQGRDGSPNQVYTRTYVQSIKLPSTRVALFQVGLNHVDTFMSVGGTLIFGDYVEAIGTINTYEGNTVSSFRAFKLGFSAYIGAADIPVGEIVTAVVTIKYTKL